MGQTLSHGVYLPNEGERNCYAGLASNWQILNTAVGNIAEKAPLVHTHTVSQITDFPAYGNTAGTICEGNDSRLSDARTPLAHTHTKSDVTDLLNSNFIPSANNSYDLGSSSYQWNNVYAKEYYYNGTEFQNKFVTLDTDQTITGQKTFRDGVFATGSKWSTTTNTTDDITYLGATFYIQQRTSGTLTDLSNGAWNVIQLGSLGLFVRNNNYGDIRYKHFYTNTLGRIHTLNSSGYEIIDLVPAVTDTYTLGTSTNKWKSLNGVNPGALSLPGEYSSSVTEYITDKTGGNNAYTAPADGWVGIRASSVTLDSANFIFMGRTSDGSTYFAQNTSSSVTAYWGNQYHGCILLPVISGKTYGIRCKCDSVDARFYRANGNVS